MRSAAVPLSSSRRIIADVTRDGGVPPLMLDPIDFVAQYQRSKAAAAGEA